MRNDYAQLLVEHPRSNSASGYHEVRARERRDLEAPIKQGMRRPNIQNWNAKSFSDSFKPFYGWLHKNVGRPWNDVFSEMCASLRGSGATAIDHVRSHVKDFLVIQPMFIDGKPYHSPYMRFGSPPTPLNGRHYVDHGGILRYAPEIRRSRYEQPKPIGIRIDTDSWYQQIDGVWYRVWTRPLPDPVSWQPAIYDVLLKRWFRVNGRENRWSNTVSYDWPDDDLRKLYGIHDRRKPAIYAYRKEQLNSKEIRKAGLNDK